MNTTSGLHFLVSLSDDYEQLSENVGYISEIYSNKNTEEGSENDTNTQGKTLFEIFVIFYEIYYLQKYLKCLGRNTKMLRCGKETFENRNVCKV